MQLVSTGIGLVFYFRATKHLYLGYSSTYLFIRAGILKFSTFYKENLRVFGGKRIAIVCEWPDDIVFPILIQTKDFAYESMPFSTLKAGC